jgi:hypothetical protein
VQLIKLVEQFAELTSGFDSQLAQRIALETLLIRLSKASVDISVETVLEKLLLLGAGGFTPGTPQTPPRSAPPDPPDAGPALQAPAAPAKTRRTEARPAQPLPDAEPPLPVVRETASNEFGKAPAGVSVEDERSALEDPAVAGIVEEFKGRIVEVRRAAPSPNAPRK